MFILLSGVQPLSAQSTQLHVLNFKKAKDLKAFFAYKEGNSILVTGHRGGYATNYVENTIESMENVLRYMPAFFEIDPRLTKDSVIVLMHDGTLDRVSTSKGKVRDYTYEELKSVRLKDHLGNVTNCKIPTLEETIVWSKGKTIINLDKKDVPLPMIAALIKKHKAERHVMLTVHSGAQARYYYDRFPEIMFSAHIRNQKEFEDIEISGVPWSNIMAYVGYTIDAKNKAIC
ncbi:MAG: glycerophosphodiester phosphodiesterase family protein, partial [Bacteroidaceae bacterium]